MPDTVRQLTYSDSGCKRAIADGLNPLTIGHMPSDSSQKNSAQNCAYSAGGLVALLRIVHPTTPAISEAARMPSLAVFTSALLEKARSVIKSDIVKPIPASQPAP